MTEERLFPCAVVGCITPPITIETDEKWTVVECAEHEARTRWETNPPDVGELQIIRPGWSNYLNARRK